MEPEVYKIGIPVNSIETYMKKIEEKEYSYKEEQKKQIVIKNI